MEPPPPAPAAWQGEPGKHRESVLFVDPMVALHEQVQAMLSEAFEVRHATTAAEALAALSRRLPDLLVMEVDLPDISGLDLCERLRADPATQKLPILFLTTRAEIHEKVAGFEVGADDYLVKPVNPRFFSARLSLLLRIKELQKRAYSSPENSPTPPPSATGGPSAEQ